MERKLYVGIDIHKKAQKVTLLSLPVLQQQTDGWKKTKPLTIRNNSSDYELLYATINKQVPDNSQVCIAVDHTGGYYSAPIVYFLTSRGYTIYYLASRSIKDAKERFLHEENKTDKLDSA